MPKEEWQQRYKERLPKISINMPLKVSERQVPFSIAIENFKYEILYDTLNMAVPVYNEILDKEKDNFEVVGEPDFDDKEVSEDGLKMVITTAIRPILNGTIQRS